MFERYTEKARRVIFFARYEAAQSGSPYIETEHILLGLLCEDKWLFGCVLPKLAHDSIRNAVKPRGDKTETSVDLPLSNESRRALAYAAQEAERLTHQHIGTEHLLLGLLREKHAASELLSQQGATLAELRLEIAKLPPRPQSAAKTYQIPPRRFPSPKKDTIELHGSRWNFDHIRDAVARQTQYSWHWHKRAWTPQDIVVERANGSISFDLTLAQDAAKFELVKGGWEKDRCAVCRWELFESAEDLQHGLGYNNGHDWLCIECYEKFLLHPEFFSSAYPEIT